MLDRIWDMPGVGLDRKTYYEQMAHETGRLTGLVWKVERSQFFTEQPDDPAWQAFSAGDWQRSLAVFESERTDRQATAARYARQGSEFRRVRIVEHPVSAYVQWEMQALKITNESGQPIRVVDAGKVSDLEHDHPLPELVVVGHQVLFEVCYDENWASCGARRIDDPHVIEQAVAEIAQMWAMAEPLADYFAREIAPLPVPTL